MPRFTLTTVISLGTVSLAPFCGKRRNPLRKLSIALFLLVFFLAGTASAQSWIPAATFPGGSANHALLLTDGTVMVQDFFTGNWWRLTPDKYGSYDAGMWSPLASMPSNYCPYAYASAALPDGRVIVEGGEYNPCEHPQTALGAIFDATVSPPMGHWDPVLPPPGWTTISDAPSVVLPDGTFMLGNAYTKEEALLNPITLTWTPTGLYQAEYNNEAGWTLLPGMMDSPSGSVLVVNAFFPLTDGRTSERYFPPPFGFWTPAGSTIVSLFPCGGSGLGCEIGPAVLRPDGTVLATGASFTTSPAHTAFYHTATSDLDYASWTAGPDFPLDPSGNGLAITDGSAALLPNGNVLVGAAVRFGPPTYFYEFTLAPNYQGGSFVQVDSPPNAQNVLAQAVHLLVLPTGQVMYTDQSQDVEIYAPASQTYAPAWAPKIPDCGSVCSVTIYKSQTNVISGTGFNGMSQGAMFGDDAQMATNYPLVRITVPPPCPPFLKISCRPLVYYCRTHDHSSMGVATGNLSVSTSFDCPDIPIDTTGLLQVVANGIPSNAEVVYIQP
jgi:hypothetical protein